MIPEVNVIVERIGRATAQFEPGTSFYNEEIIPLWKKVERAETRDDLEFVMDELVRALTPHLTDEALNDLNKNIGELRSTDRSWPVEAFKEAFQIGSGQKLAEDKDAITNGLDRK